MLPFPLIHMGPNGMAIGARKPRVNVDQRLRVVISRRHIFEAIHRVSDRAAIDHRGAAGLELIDVHGEERRLPTPRSGLLQRRRSILFGEHYEYAAGYGSGCGRRRERKLQTLGRMRKCK